jgi:hypothetical protein
MPYSERRLRTRFRNRDSGLPRPTKTSNAMSLLRSNVNRAEAEANCIVSQRRPPAFDSLLLDLLDLSMVQTESEGNELSAPKHVCVAVLRLDNGCEDFLAAILGNLLGSSHRVSFK